MEITRPCWVWANFCKYLLGYNEEYLSYAPIKIDPYESCFTEEYILYDKVMEIIKDKEYEEPITIKFDQKESELIFDKLRVSLYRCQVYRTGSTKL